ncbi:unnamed protein product [Sphagnum jensenii]|uniref:Nardilysin n=2 Tax=Sphagnum jensenii TaxID=128206 RepID=A0ABP0VKX5_9BRYO
MVKEQEKGVMVVEGPPVLKTPTDQLCYRVITLANGLSVLLIHDPSVSEAESNANNSKENGNAANATTSMELDYMNNLTTQTAHAAAAMCVGVGSFSDPKDAQGLAHFLEHMLFMGSSKFPNECEYDNFLSEHGGSSNAFTETEYTCYYFDVMQSYFKDCLDRFAQFFLSPLVKVEAMDREVQAIDSEFEQVMQNDACRLLQLQCHTSSPSHPFHTFSWGNKKSLNEPMEKGVDMRGKLLQLYNDHYQAGCMKLAILGGEQLDTLSQWAVELFGGVRQGGKEQMKFSTWKPPDPVWEAAGCMYHIESVTDQHLLVLVWPLPCLQSSYLKKPEAYLSHLISHEGAGGLLLLLRGKGWGTSLSAGVADGGFAKSSAGYMFHVAVQLTTSGLQHVFDVVGFLHQYIKMLRTIGPQEWVFKELQSISNMEFQFAEEIAAADHVVTLATNMRIYSECDIIYGDYAFEQWDPELLTELLSYLTPSNMRLDLMTKPFDKNVPGVKFEPWFEIAYTVETISKEILQAWADPAHIDSALHMPSPNEFIPHNFSIYIQTIAAKKNKCDSIKSSLVVLLDEPALRLWYKLDQTFQMPRANAFFCVLTRTASNSVKAAVLTEMYVNLLLHELNETMYLANMANLESSITVHGFKLELKLFGFNEKLPVLVRRIMEFHQSLVVTPELFQAIKEDMERDFRNAETNPLTHSSYLRLQALKSRFWHVDDRLTCLLSLSTTDLTKFIPTLFHKTYIEALCHGNLLEVEALDIANIFKKALVRNPLPPRQRPQDFIIKLPASICLLLQENVKNMNEENSVAELYFQIGQDQGIGSTHMRCMTSLFEHIVYEPFFNQLRTKEQLGYVVDCGTHDTLHVLGFGFRVQSSRFSPPFLEARIHAFIETIPTMLNDMKEDEFESHKSATAEQKLEVNCSLLDETDHYWDNIWDQRYLFEQNKVDAMEVKKIRKNEVVKWCRRHFGCRSTLRQELCIHIWGANALLGKVNDNERPEDKMVPQRRVMLVHDLEDFKVNQEVFPPLH